MPWLDLTVTIATFQENKIPELAVVTVRVELRQSAVIGQISRRISRHGVPIFGISRTLTERE
jgi:hypothetical protein